MLHPMLHPDGADDQSGDCGDQALPADLAEVVEGWDQLPDYVRLAPIGVELVAVVMQTQRQGSAGRIDIGPPVEAAQDVGGDCVVEPLDLAAALLVSGRSVNQGERPLSLTAYAQLGHDGDAPRLAAAMLEMEPAGEKPGKQGDGSRVNSCPTVPVRWHPQEDAPRYHAPLAHRRRLTGFRLSDCVQGPTRPSSLFVSISESASRSGAMILELR